MKITIDLRELWYLCKSGQNWNHTWRIEQNKLNLNVKCLIPVYTIYFGLYIFLIYIIYWESWKIILSMMSFCLCKFQNVNIMLLKLKWIWTFCFHKSYLNISCNVLSSTIFEIRLLHWIIIYDFTEIDSKYIYFLFLCGINEDSSLKLKTSWLARFNEWVHT